jgi:hypothetical protein
LQILKINRSYFFFASDELKENEEFNLKLIRNFLDIFDFIPYKFKNNIDFMRKAIKIHNRNIQFASENLKNDK